MCDLFGPILDLVVCPKVSGEISKCFMQGIDVSLFLKKNSVTIR